jgi:cytochrome P450
VTLRDGIGWWASMVSGPEFASEAPRNTAAHPADESARPVLASAGGALPLIGHGLALYRRPLELLESLPAHGRLVRIRMGPLTVIVVCDPELTDRMLREDRVFDKGGPLYDKARESMGNGLVTCPHAEHRRQRRLCQPAFHLTRLKGYAPLMAEQIGRMVDSWRPGSSVDVMAALYALTGRVAVQTMFGADLPLAVANQSVEDLHTIVAGTYRRMLAPGWVNRLPTRGNRRYDQARTRLRSSIGQIAADRRAGSVGPGGDDPPESADSVGPWGDDPPEPPRGSADLLSALLSARDDAAERPGADNGSAREPAGLSETEVVDQVVSFFMAGTETTASVLAWAVHLVAGHPEVEARLHTELDGVLAGRVPTAEDIPDLPYTGRIVTETLRLYPPGWFFTRRTAEDCELAGVRLAAGTTLAYSPYLIHRLPSVYPDPHRFDPDRWDQPEGAADRPAVRGAFIPFAAGRRKCIGEDFGRTEAILALAAISARWLLRPAPGARVRPNVGATMAARDLRMLPTPRHGARLRP